MSLVVSGIGFGWILVVAVAARKVETVWNHSFGMACLVLLLLVIEEAS